MKRFHADIFFRAYITFSHQFLASVFSVKNRVEYQEADKTRDEREHIYKKILK